MCMFLCNIFIMIDFKNEKNIFQDQMAVLSTRFFLFKFSVFDEKLMKVKTE